MGYRLGVDLGTTFTAAAVDDGTGPTDAGAGQPGADGAVGGVPRLRRHLALRRGGRPAGGLRARPGRPASSSAGSATPSRSWWPASRSPRRRSPPSCWPGWSRSPTERQGVGPDEVVVTYPANWGGYKRELLDQLVTLADVSPAADLHRAGGRRHPVRLPRSARRRRQGRGLRPRRRHLRRVRAGEAGRPGSRSSAPRTASSTWAASTSTRRSSSTSSGMLADRMADLDPDDPEVTNGAGPAAPGVRGGQGGPLQRRRGHHPGRPCRGSPPRCG